MQVMEKGRGKSSKTTITVTEDIKMRVRALKRGNQTYNDVLDTVLRMADVSERREGEGVVFLYSVMVRGDEKKLKRPIPLELHLNDDGTMVLSNDEFSLLVVCSHLKEGLKEAQLEFSSEYDIFCNPELPEKAVSAREYGKKLQDMIWM
ncbi:hypothetical protein McpSp1_12850 [Methanocorpusculaceae archaeon Sp1]|nr:hypothetical protein [Methanocorpusculaceae archaeon Sp1]